MSYHSRKTALLQDSQFKFLRSIYFAMDKYFLDPILGLFGFGLGDIITTACTIPFVTTTIFKLRSIPLTLSIIRNALIDMLCGLFPIIGDIFDIFNRSYKKSYEQIIGYVDEDKDVIDEVNSGALMACILITVLSIAIRLAFLLLASIFGWFKGLFS